jgi:predicted DsbA family dithiol-disulfide isomerase
MELTILTVPDCPNAAALEGRLEAVLAGYPDTIVRRRQVADEQEAAETGMAGSPTLLINGMDPFAVPGQVPGLSCRLYRDAAGRIAGAPPVEDLRRALERASADDRLAP